MKIIIAIEKWSLRKVNCPLLPYCWYCDHGPGYTAFMRDDGLIYCAGFETQEKAEAWAVKEGIMDAPADS